MIKYNIVITMPILLTSYLALSIETDHSQQMRQNMHIIHNKCIELKMRYLRENPYSTVAVETKKDLLKRLNCIYTLLELTKSDGWTEQNNHDPYCGSNDRQFKQAIDNMTGHLNINRLEAIKKIFVEAIQAVSNKKSSAACHLNLSSPEKKTDLKLADLMNGQMKEISRLDDFHGVTGGLIFSRRYGRTSLLNEHLAIAAGPMRRGENNSNIFPITEVITGGIMHSSYSETHFEENQRETYRPIAVF